MNKTQAQVSVIMPTYNQASFIRRAISSIQLQTLESWELLVINDGSTDSTHEIMQDLLSDDRIIYIKNQENIGLGSSINIGLEHARYDLIAYLPSDDIYYKNHLLHLAEVLVSNKDVLLSYSNMRYNYLTGFVKHYKFTSDNSTIDSAPMQLVQVMHRKTQDRWLTREEMVTDNLDFMFWDKLADKDLRVATQQISCEWVYHPQQRHRIISESLGGGIYFYKQYYNVKKPIVFESTSGNHINEVEYFQNFRDKFDTTSSSSLKIVLVGELAYNAERIYALEERGHQLYGLWMERPACYNAIGPLPFGNVEDIPLDKWKERVEEIKPDIIYALLNYTTVPFAHKILQENPGIPFVWHFKEGPFHCRQTGMWSELIDLFSKSDGQIYTNAETKDWFAQFLPDVCNNSHILDGDLPSGNWFSNNRSTLLSSKDGEFHTVVPGRPFGLIPEDIAALAQERIHLHFYGDAQQQLFQDWLGKAAQLAPGYLHIHPNCTQLNWVEEFSQYDAGWLHSFKSENEGEIMRAEWDDLNYPARMATLAAAGLPMLQMDNTNHIVATQSLTKKLDVGVFFKNFPDLGKALKDEQRMAQIRENVWTKRQIFSFDYHVDDLISFFHSTIIKTKIK